LETVSLFHKDGLRSFGRGI